ncbi:hypothetical protein OQA88_2599 [Cercophora sp. LCS_1]
MATNENPDNPPLSSATLASTAPTTTTPENAAVIPDERDVLDRVVTLGEIDRPTEVGADVVAELVPVLHIENPHSAAAQGVYVDEERLIRESPSTQETTPIELVPLHAQTAPTDGAERLAGCNLDSSPFQSDHAVLSEHGRFTVVSPQAAQATLGDPATAPAPRLDQQLRRSNESHSLRTADLAGDAASSAPPEPVSPLSWRPLSFSLWSLGLLGVLTIAANAALLYLFITSEKNQGVAPVATVPVLVRRFVPTAGQSQSHIANVRSQTVLSTTNHVAAITALRLLWGHIDFRVRQLQPWVALKEGATSTVKGIDADYISTFMPKKLWLAIRNRHWLVVCTMVGTLLWIAMVVFAGGLFHEADVQVTRQVQLVVPDRFDAAAFLGRPGPDSRMVYTLLAVGQDRFRLSLPPGTTFEYAAQGFGLGPGTNREIGNRSRSLAGSVDVFVGELECETGETSYVPEWVGFCGPSSGDGTVCSSGPGFLVNVTTPSCELVNLTAPAQQSSGGYENPIPNDQYYGQVQLVNCSDPTSPTGSGHRDYRLLVTLLLSREFRSNVIPCKGCSPVGPPFLEMLHLSHILCKPWYRIVPGLVTVTVNGDGDGDGDGIRSSLSVQVPEGGGATTTLEGVTPDDFTFKFVNSLMAASQVEHLFSSTNETVHVPTPLRLAMLHSSHSIDDMLEPRVLEQSFVKLYQALSAQFAKTQMMGPATTTTTIPGTATFVERRLLVRRVSFGGMQELFLLMYALMLCLAWHLGSWELPRDPSSMAAVALLLRGSRHLLGRVEGLGHVPRTQTAEIVGRERRFHVRRGPGAASFEIVEAEAAEPADAGQVETETALPSTEPAAAATDTALLKHWTGYPMKWYGIALYTAVPLLLIIGLEISFWQINSKDVLGGVLPVTAVRNVWAYLPVAVMVVASLVLVSFNLTVVTTTPFLALHKGHCAPRDGVLADYLARPSLFALPMALRRRHWAVAAASVVSIIGVFLAIVAGGLFYEEGVPLSVRLVAEPAHVFLPAPFNETENTIPGLYAHLIVQNNLTYPDGTYRDLVLPFLDLKKLREQVDDSLADEDTIMEVELPALRPRLACLPMRSDHIRIDRRLGQDGVPQLDPVIGIPLPRCVASVVDPFEEDGISRLAYDLGYFPDRGYFGGVGTFGLPSESCPAIFVVLGKVDGLTVQDVSAIGCTGRVTEVSVRAAFRLHAGDDGISLASPPSIISGDNRAQNVSEHSMYFLSHVFSEVDVTAPQNDDDTGAVIDSFLQAAVYGSRGVPLADLLGRNGSNTTQLAARVSELYGIATAQYVDQTWRFEMTEEERNTAKAFPAQVTYPNRIWLRQSLVETRLLDAMLATLVLCAVGVYLLVRPNSVVPKNPHPILSIASLVAGSKWMHLLESEQSVAEAVANRTFSLKWWEGSEDDGLGRYGIDMDGRA